MKPLNLIQRTTLLLAVCCACSQPAHATTVGTGFTYQGQIKDDGAPANGSYDMTFTLFDAATVGNQIGPMLSDNDLPVANGLFTTTLDFGSAVFTGNARWLEIAVRPGGSVGSYTPLTPRQPLTAAPYATFATAPWVTSGYNVYYNLGNVGIGALSPLTPLDVRGAANTGQGAVNGLQTSGSASGAGVYGHSNVAGGNGVIGEANGAQAYGVWGKTDAGYAIFGASTTGFGGFFQGKGYFSDKVGIGINPPVAMLDVRDSTLGTTIYAASTPDYAHCIDARADGVDGAAVFGNAQGQDGIGVAGYSFHGHGLDGYSPNDVGVYGQTSTGYAGYFVGRVSVIGTLSKSSGSFKIDHPLDPANKYLYHSFVESPDMMNVYNGLVTTDARGYATVTMPAWFDALNRDFRYQLTVIDDSDSSDFAQAKIVERVHDNQFTLRTSRPNVQVSWQLTGIRKDAFAEANRIPVEEDKVGAERGKYLHPEAFNQPAEMGICFERGAAAQRAARMSNELSVPVSVSPAPMAEKE